MSCCVVPTEIEGFVGVTAIDSNVGAAAKNVIVVEPTIEPKLAVMAEVPGPAPDAKPLLVTLATAEFDEVHVAELVTSSVLPSLKVPVAANCCVVPRASMGFAGVTVIDTKVGVTAKNAMVVDPAIEPEVAVIVEVPAPAPDTSPLLVTEAAEEFEEVQVADFVRS